MLRGAILLSLIGSVAASTVCSILDDFLPTDLGCSCEAAASGVGGEATCSQTTPGVDLYLASVPSIVVQIGTELLPCGDPAKASVHLSISLPSSITSSQSMMLMINTGLMALNQQSGISAEIDGGDTIKVEEAVEAGSETAIDLPIYALSSSYQVSLRINVALNGNIAGLSLESSVDMCLIISDTSYCGADLPKCESPYQDYEYWFCKATFGTINVNTRCSSNRPTRWSRWRPRPLRAPAHPRLHHLRRR